MTAALERWLARLVAALVALGLAAAVSGAGPVPGGAAFSSLRAWWDARLFEDATGRKDYRRMVGLGVQLRERAGDGVPLRFALERLALEGSALTQGRVPADALAWSAAALNWLERTEGLTADPWGATYLRALLLVDRVFPLTGNAEAEAVGLEALETWLAAGGGLEGSPAAGRNYRLLMDLPPEARAGALRASFEPAEE